MRDDLLNELNKLVLIQNVIHEGNNVQLSAERWIGIAAAVQALLDERNQNIGDVTQ